MNFNIIPVYHVRQVLRSREFKFFAQAKSGSMKSREWIRDVVRKFADDSDLQFSQAWMLISCGNFNHGLKMHARACEKIPKTITVLGQTKPNPVFVRVKGISEMLPSDYEQMLKHNFSIAIGIRHPDDYVAKRGESEGESHKDQKFKETVFKLALVSGLRKVQEDMNNGSR
jgi:hypothetical protein